MSGWAIDLGTTNTVIARWDEGLGRPALVSLPAISRKPGGIEQLEAPEAIPSATHLLGPRDVWSRLGRWRPIARNWFIGQSALIGRQALERNEVRPEPCYAPSFKRLLGRASLRPLARVEGTHFTVRDVARAFVREVLREIKTVTGERLRELVVTTPVDAYESYRAELSTIFEGYGVVRLRFIDEPVAAAIGYGLSIGKERRVLVVDFGGGTLHVALVALSAKEAEGGGCRVLAKEARPIGGEVVDGWIRDELCRRLDCAVPAVSEDEDETFWARLMLVEARRVKEAVFFHPSETFHLIPPEDLGNFRIRGRDLPTSIDVTREDLIGILRANGLYSTLEGCLTAIGRIEGIDLDGVDDVLMVGGSTLLPGVYPLFEERFGRDRVRAWQPFDAVAYGASVFAAGRCTQSDFIVHDYAFVTFDPKTHEKEYTVIVPRGTRFPTPMDLWKRQLVPTCSLGEAERLFKLVICEIGSEGGDRRFAWDAQGRLHQVGKGSSTRSNGALVVPLNESNPTLGHLDPPHPPDDARARLEIGFGVDPGRWLLATVYDLRTRRFLLKEKPVVRLL